MRGWSLALLVLLPAAAHANDLDRMYQLALARDTTLQTAVAQRDAAIEVKPQAVAQLLPQLNAGGSGSRQTLGVQLAQPATSQVGEVNGCGLSSDLTTEHCTGNAHDYTLSLTQTLWSFQAFNQLREANALAASAQATLLSARQDLLLRVAEAYFNILAARDQLGANRAERDGYGTLLNQARGREQTGVGPRSESEQAQSYFDATEQGVIDARSILDDAQLALAEIVGSNPGEVASLQEDIPLTRPDPASADEWVTAAIRDNPAVRAAQLQVDAADRDIAVQEGKGLPTLTLGGSTQHTWQQPAFGGNETDQSINLSINWPLFQGGAVASSMRQSRALYRQALAQYEAIKRDTERQTRAAYRNVVSGIERITVARRAVESGRVAVEASQRNLEFGTGGEFELLNAQSNYSNAQRAYSQTRYDYLTALLTLKQQAGRLSEADLAAIDAMLVTR